MFQPFRYAGLSALVLLAACANDVQTTSGAAYRAVRPGVGLSAGDKSVSDIDRAVDQVAKVEPLLRFPARIGLARIQNGQLGAVPPREADAWIAFGQKHPEYGTYVPISPLVAGMAAGATPYTARGIVDEIRLGAARQHVDAVLIYAVTGGAQDKASVLSVLDLTIVGAYLIPSRSLSGSAVASATLIDVRNGYPYGTASATADRAGFVASVGSERRADELMEDAQTVAVGKLTGEVETMMARLRTELGEKDLADLRAKPGPATALRRIRGR